MHIGFDRVSAAEQDLTAQLDALGTWSVEEQNVVVDRGLRVRTGPVQGS